MKGLLNGFQGLLAGLLFFGALLFLDQTLDVRFQGLQCVDQGRIALVLNNAAAGAGCEIQERHIHQALDIARDPGLCSKPGSVERSSITRVPTRVNATRAVSLGSARYSSAYASPNSGADRRQLVQQSTLELPRFDFVLLARELVDHRYASLRVADPVPQLRGQIPLDLLAAQACGFPRAAGLILSSVPFSANNTRRGLHLVPRIPLAHRHLVGALIGAGRGHGQACRPPSRSSRDRYRTLLAILRRCRRPSAVV